MNSPKIEVRLTDREAGFLMALARGLKPTRAATEAGFSVGHAHAVLRKPHVEATLRHMRANLDRVVAKLDAG